MLSLLANYSIEASLVFMPLHAADLGASDFLVGVVGAAYGLSYFLSSLLFGRLSDIKGRVQFVRAGLLLVAASYLAQTLAPSPGWLILCRLAVGFSMGVSSGPLMAYVYERDGAVGRFTSVGSFGWLLGSLAAIVIPHPLSLFATSAIASCAAFLLSLTLRDTADARRERKPCLPSATRGCGAEAPCPGQPSLPSMEMPPWSPVSPPPSGGSTPSEARGEEGVAGSAFSVLRSNSRVYLAFFLRHVGATAVWAVFPLYLSQLGASKPWIAALNSINMGGQAVAMRFVERFDPARMLLLGLHLSMLVFGIYAIATDYLQLVPVQVVLAVAWSCLFVGSLSFLLKRNVDRGTASGLLYSTNSLATSAGPLVGGTVSQLTGTYPAVMVTATAFSAAAWTVARKLRSRPR